MANTLSSQKKISLKMSDIIPARNLAGSKNGKPLSRFSPGRAFRTALSWRKLLRKELKSPIKTGVRQKLDMYKIGFLSESYIIYQLDKNESRHYLSDYDRFVKTPSINRSYHIILDNKLVFRTFMQPHKRFLPKDYGIIENNNFYPLDGSIDFLNIDKIVEQEKKLV
ncbi:hypothetical protein GF337_10185, partial [candidate division KSB1 bacterium]|nr:hypothetical protein [candidate division KSB1 bacterium]